MFLRIFFSILFTTQFLCDPIPLSNNTPIAITNTDTGYFNYTFIITSSMVPCSVYVLMEATTATAQATLYASVNSSASCTYNDTPTSLNYCFSSGWGGANSILSMNFEEETQLAVSALVSSTNTEFKLTLLAIPVLEVFKGSEVLINTFGSSQSYTFSRYFQYIHDASDYESIYLIVEGRSSLDSANLYVSVNCSNKPFNWFPSQLSYFKATLSSDIKNYIQLNLDNDAPCLVSVAVTIAAYKSGFDFNVLSYPFITMSNNTKLTIDSLNSSMNYLNFYRFYTYTSKEYESPGAMNFLTNGLTSSDTVRVYAKTNCSATCVFTHFPFNRDSCYSTYYSSPYQILTVPFDEPYCKIIVAVLIDSYSLGVDVKIINYQVISLRNNTYSSIYSLNPLATGVPYWRYYSFEAKEKGSANILLEGATNDDVGGIYAMTDCEPGCAFSYFPSKISNCYKKYEAQNSFVTINLYSPCNISVGISITTISVSFQTKVVHYPIIELPNNVPLFINSFDSTVGYELFYRYFKYTLKETDAMGNLTITLEGLSSGDPNQLYVTTDCQSNCTANDYPRANNLFCYYTTYSTFSSLQIYLQTACTVSIAAYFTQYNLGARIKAYYYNICPNAIDKCVTCNVSQVNGNDTTLCYGCKNLYAANPETHLSCQFCNMTVGYFVDNSNSGFCEKCQDNCYNCTNSTACLQCDIGYRWNSLSSTSFLSNCTCAIANCTNCSAGTCLLCDQGYGLYAENNVCLPCLLENCEACSFESKTFTPSCDKCKDNMMFSNGSCRNCSSLIANCSLCRDANSCALCSQGFYLKKDSLCGQCGDSNTTGCSVCSADFACSSCQTGYYLAEDMTCIACAQRFPYCSACDTENCSACNAGYFLSSVSACEPCGVSHCKQCDNGEVCDVCEDEYTIFNNTCVSCNNDTGLTNCLLCDIGETEKKCLQCKATFFMNDAGGCDSCFPNSALCVACTNLSFCEQCDTGGYLYVDSQGSRTCVASCPQGTVLNLLGGVCETCQAVFGKNCKNCTSQGCTQCDVESVTPFLYGNSCSACNETNQKLLNYQYCYNSPKVSSFSAGNVAGFFVNIMINCSIESSVFFVYGLHGAADGVPLSQVQGVTGVVPTNDTVYDWVGYGGGIATDIYGFLNITLNGPFKNSGETYSIKAWCVSENQYTSASSAGNTTTWSQRDNGAKVVELRLMSSNYLNFGNKPLVAQALQNTIKLSRRVFTEDAIPAESYASARRVLQQNFYYNYSFFIAPDFTVTYDPLIEVINSSLMNSTLFGEKITAALRKIDSTSAIKIVNTALVGLSNNTNPPQGFLAGYPEFSVQNQTIFVKFILQTEGKVYLGAKVADNNYAVSSAGVVNATLSWDSFKNQLDYFGNNFVKFSKSTAKGGVLLQANLSELSANTSYFVFYGAGNNNFPENTTKIGIQSVRTGWLWANASQGSSGSERTYINYFCFLIVAGLLGLVISI